ncbi:MAG: hypothetical protein ACKVQJ_03670 [Pyrinomonadaceae bacterium]
MPVRTAKASVKAATPVTSSPPAAYQVYGSGFKVSSFLEQSGLVGSVLGLVTPTVKKQAPKTEDAAVEPPSASTAPPNPFMPSGSAADLAVLRLNPKNATGGTNLYSRNFGWGTSLVGLPGRAGLDAGFGIGYNSLVWLKDPTNSEVIFDPDTSNVSPGFQMGFPIIEQAYYDPDKAVYVQLMITPEGKRIEFRCISGLAFTQTYESTDSTYTRLNVKASRGAQTYLLVTSTDGTQMTYYLKGNVWRCTKILDRNGNYITIAYDTYNLLQTITDTLGRVITVNYDSYNYPTSITQTWKDTNGSGSNVTHTWATLSYTTATVSTSFSGLTVIGPANSTTVKVLDKITYPDSSFTKFEYNGYIQVKKISQVAADSTSHVLNYVSTDLDSVTGSQTDCPRFGATRSWVENFNLNGSGVPQETVVTNSITTGATYSLPNSISGSATRIDVAMTGHPDGLYSRTYVGASGYKEGLPLATEDCTGTNCATRLRWTWTDWTQDNTSLSYVLNPRVVESRVGDGTNTKRTTVGYGSNGYGLPEMVKLYDSDLSTVLKTQTTAYELGSTYTNRRIIGLPSETKLYEGTDSGTLMSKVTYAYDEGNMTGTDPVQNISPTQHDNTSYSSSFVSGRGNLTSVTRWDATAPTTSGSAVTSSMKYNTAGAVVSQTDPLSHTVKIAYADSFNTTGNPSSYAYPTTITDQAGNSSTVKYRYDIGVNVEAISPAPAGQTYGKTSKRLFDSIGRLDRQSIYVNTTEKAYTRYEYPTNGVQSKSYTPIIDADGDGNIAEDEVYSESWFDGAGRIRRSRTEHPGSTGGWSATQVEYDILGRTYRTSVPTEVSVSGDTWTAAGDDATRGWIWNYAYYDWKGRTTRTVPSDSSGSDGKDTLISYAGCGCAGGMVTTIEGPLVPRDDTSGNARRTQKVYEDILGRAFKTETYQWDGTTVYNTNVLTFNGRDQVTLSREYAGTTSSSTYQDTTATFDGHGRLATKHIPQQSTSTATTYNYNLDDSISSITDARGAVTNLTYNSRGLLTGKSWTVPTGSGITDPADVTFSYDNLGNRTQMTDGLGQVDYNYNELSQMTGETRTFDSGLTDAPQSTSGFQFSYAYHIGGSLKNVTYPNQITMNYGMDKAGKLETVSGISDGEALSVLTNVDYLAWGGMKRVDFGNNTYSQITYNNRLLPDTEKFTGKRQSLGVFETATLIDNQYSYYSDGAIKLIEDKANISPYSYLDRLHQYDNTGRLVAERSGREALQTAQNGDFIKYAYNFSHDAFGNTKTEQAVRAYSSFGGSGQFTNVQVKNYTFQNNRRTGGFVTPVAIYGNIQLPAWQYDSDGRPVVSFDTAQINSTYSAGGLLEKQSSGYTGAGGIVQDLWYDGNGELIKTKDTDTKTTDEDGEPANFTQTSTRYVINSSVLGEALVYQDNKDTRYPAAINKETKTSIYGLGNKLAVQDKIEGGIDGVTNPVIKTTDFKYKSAYESKRLKSEYSAEASNGLTSMTSVSTRGLDANAITHTPSGRGNSDGKPRFDEDFAEWLTGEGCTIEGIIEPCRNALKSGGEHSGSAIPSELQKLQHLKGFYFDDVGLGLFRSPAVFQNVHTGSLNTYGEGEQIFGGGLFSVNGLDRAIGAGMLVDASQAQGSQKRCVFNINLNVTDSGMTQERLVKIKTRMTEIFESAGQTLVFNNPRSASNTRNGSYDLTISERLQGGSEFSNQNVPLLAGYIYGETYTDNRGNLKNSGNVSSYWIQRRFADPAMNELDDLIAAIGSHEAAHWFLRNLYGKKGGHSWGFDIMGEYSKGIRIGLFNGDQARTMSQLCK